MEYNVSELFYSIQGEGPHVGRPSVFLRFSGCNLRCKWGDNLCDTPYTSWYPETNKWTFERVLKEVQNISGGCKNLIITGGEPTLQVGLNVLVDKFKELGFVIDLETNGTREVPSGFDCIICSPKLSCSIPVGDKYENRHRVEIGEISKCINPENPAIYLKFVVGKATSIDEINALVLKLGFPPNRVYLMPEGLTPEQLHQTTPLVVKLAMQNGYIFTPRLHILIWGSKRGV